VEQREADEHWREHCRSGPSLAGERGLPQDTLGRTDEVRHVQRPAPGVTRRILRGAQAGLNPRLEGTEGMVGKPVVVLYQVEAGAGERPAERRELLWPESHRLERCREEGPAGDAGERAQSRDAGPWTGQPVERRIGKLDIREDDVRLERGVAEDDVEELRRVERGGSERVGNPHAVAALGLGMHPLNLPQDPLRHPGIPHRRTRQLHRLFEQQCLGAGIDFPGGSSDEIGYMERGFAHGSTAKYTGIEGSTSLLRSLEIE
jgi:hypothetical protein